MAQPQPTLRVNSGMVIETLSEELFEGWTKLAVFALILAVVFGLLFSLMKFSERKEKSSWQKRGVRGVNRKHRRYEQARKRRRRSR